MATLIENGYPIFTDSKGDPLEEGYIFIGEAGLNPISNPQTAYWDASLTVPATNIRTKGGYPVYNGSPSRLFVPSNYSIVIQDCNRNTVQVILDAQDFVTVTDPAAGFDRTEVVVKNTNTVTVKAGSSADVDGTVAEVLSDTDLVIPLVDTPYYILMDNTGAVSISIIPGTFDVSRNGRYVGNDRILNWQIRRDTYNAWVNRIEEPIDERTALITAEVAYPIGGWDMDTLDNAQVNHGLSSLELERVVDVEVVIVNDNGDTWRSLEYSSSSTSAGSWTLFNTYILLNRYSGGVYDNTSYDDATINRGYVYIKYLI